MSENCPKCGSEWIGGVGLACGSCEFKGSFNQSYQCQIAALTQQKEQAERERDRLRELSQKQQGEIEDIGYMADAVERLREIANATGCDHVDDSDGRLRLVSCVEQVIWSAECKAETAEAEVKRMREIILLYDAQLEGLGRDVADATTELEMMRKAWIDLRDSLVELNDETTVCIVELMDSLMVIAE
jgi:chromosome segregation ATPase